MSIKINEETIKKLSELSKLAIDPSEYQFFIDQINQINQNVISKIHTIECEAEPLLSVNQDNLALNQDIEGKRNSRDEIFSMCTKSSKSQAKMLNYIPVPKVIE